MLETNQDVAEKEKMINIVLNTTQQNELKKVLKCGIYKELHKRDILSDAQLNCLLKHKF